MTRRIESVVTHLLCVLFTSFLFTSQAGRRFVLMHANLLFLPAFELLAPPPLSTPSPPDSVSVNSKY